MGKARLPRYDELAALDIPALLRLRDGLLDNLVTSIAELRMHVEALEDKWPAPAPPSPPRTLRLVKGGRTKGGA
jgi:hypothetical protein